MSFHNNIVNNDIISVFMSKLQAKEYCVCAEDGKLYNTQELEGNNASLTDTPWIFVNNPPNYHCRWRHVIADVLGFIPTHCLNCWKVVVRPRTLEELYKLLNLMTEMSNEDPTVYCKCGIEPRPTVFGNYGGYFYTRSKEAMQERYKQVRKLVDEKISPDVDVIPKRYCSEFEAAFGPSDEYDKDADRMDYTEHWEKIIEETCVMKPFPFKQPEIIKIRTMREWIKRAWDVGDPTVYMFTDGEPLVRQVVRYYPEDENNNEGETQG